MNLTVLLKCIYALTFDGCKRYTSLTILVIYWYFVLYFFISSANKDYNVYITIRYINYNCNYLPKKVVNYNHN